MTKFPNQISTIISEQLNAVLDHYSIKENEQLQFVLFPNLTSENLNNRDEMISSWVTPNISGRKLDFVECLKFLATESNTAPVWIRSCYKNNTLFLEFSQRFRKLSVIKEANPNNKYAPFKITDIDSFDLNRINERKAIIRTILFGGNIKQSEIAKIDSLISEKEFFEYLEDHFTKYRFYPQLYNHYKIGDKRYSTLVIEKDFENNTFSIFKNSEIQHKMVRNKNLTEIGTIYLDEELDWKINEITIERNAPNTK